MLGSSDSNDAKVSHIAGKPKQFLKCSQPSQEINAAWGSNVPASSQTHSWLSVEYSCCQTWLLKVLGTEADPRRHPARKMRAYAVVIDGIIEIKCEGANPWKKQYSKWLKVPLLQHPVPASQLQIGEEISYRCLSCLICKMGITVRTSPQPQVRFNGRVWWSNSHNLSTGPVERSSPPLLPKYQG